jgi:preprotein translocase subunit SecG
MISILIDVLTVVLILVALFLSLIVLAQRAKSDAGITAMGGGMMESAFGPDTSNVLTGLTIKATVAFFVLSFLIYLGYIYRRAHPAHAGGALPNISAPATAPATAPAGTTPAPADKAATPTAAPPVSMPTTTPAPDAAKTTAPTAPVPAKSP